MDPALFCFVVFCLFVFGGQKAGDYKLCGTGAPLNIVKEYGRYKTLYNIRLQLCEREIHTHTYTSSKIETWELK